MLRIALTGNIGSGKSTVAAVWRREGAVVIEADELARRAVEPGTAALARIIERWGPGIVLPSGRLDRSALRDVVFRDAEERAHLERIIHPEVQALRRSEEERAAREGAKMVVSEIPLLFEVGLEGDFDVVVLVDAPEQVREERLIASRGLSPDEARRMIAAQWPTDRKRPHSDYVIENTGTTSDLEREAMRVWARIQARSGAPHS